MNDFSNLLKRLSFLVVIFTPKKKLSPKIHSSIDTTLNLINVNLDLEQNIKPTLIFEKGIFYQFTMFRSKSWKKNMYSSLFYYNLIGIIDIRHILR